MPRQYHFAVLLALCLAGCATTAGQADAPATAVSPALSTEAIGALARAEADVEAARAAFTLWLSAEDALRQAREAASAYDSAKVIEQAGRASELCRLGTLQAGYPTTEMK
ncbi:MAG: hypothetical protein PHS77_08395 [Gallionellaceae bacterium]|nr:hypothetical protein [Gallionellaceae bacterium]